MKKMSKLIRGSFGKKILHTYKIGTLIYKSLDEATAKYYKYVMYGPVLTVIGCFGLLGNTLSIIVFTRSCMKSALNFILVGKQIRTFLIQLVL